MEPSGSALARSTLARLRTRITGGQWPVGSRIPIEPELAEELGVGRSTIREAIRSLATLGMVETLTGRGTFVRSVTPAPTLLMSALSVYGPAELVGMLRALGVEAVQAAAATRTDGDLDAMRAALAGPHAGVCARFHSAIAQASGNRLVIDLDASLTTALEAYGLAETIAARLSPEVLAEQHARILTALEERDVAGAAHAMAVHLDEELRSLHHSPIATDLTTLSR